MGIGERKIDKMVNKLIIELGILATKIRDENKILYSPDEIELFLNKTRGVKYVDEKDRTKFSYIKYYYPKW